MSDEEFMKFKKSSYITINSLVSENREMKDFIRKCFGWCTGCKNFKGLGGCGIGKMEQCNSDNDFWQWRGGGSNENEQI
jgi:hypothetical protein